jgi:hypothetical protein
MMRRVANRPIDELSLEELLAHAGVSFFTPTKAGWHGGGEIAEHALDLAAHAPLGSFRKTTGLHSTRSSRFAFGFAVPCRQGIEQGIFRNRRPFSTW